MNQTQGHSAAGRIMSMKYANYTMGNRIHDYPACSAVPQPNLPPRAPTWGTNQQKKKEGIWYWRLNWCQVSQISETLRSDPQDLWPRLWPLNPSSTEVKTTGATHVLHVLHVLCLHVMLRPFHQRKEINRVLAPEEFSDSEYREKLYFLRIAWGIVNWALILLLLSWTTPPPVAVRKQPERLRKQNPCGEPT